MDSGKLSRRLALVAAMRAAYDVLDTMKQRKRRDRREPDRLLKENLEEKIQNAIMGMWERQAEKIRQRIASGYIAREAKAKIPDNLADVFDFDDIAEAEIIRAILESARSGIIRLAKNVGIEIDWTGVNADALDWARKYTYELIRGINDATADAVSKVIAAYVETPGMTLDDVLKNLPYAAERAEKIAVTEITRAYANGQQLAGEKLKAEYPGMRIVKMWYTNFDDRVCELCAPLDGREIDIDEVYYEPEPPYHDGNPPRHVNCRCWVDTRLRSAE